MSASFEVEYADLQKFNETIKRYQQGAESKINDYLHGVGYGKFDVAIHNAMPISGRNWQGKKVGAKKANSLQDKDKSENLAVTIRAKTAYGYLYFPDDGSNTERHVGNQRFFERGVEEKETEAINDMIELLTRLD